MEGLTHWFLSHQLYKVTRGQERGGASVSARGASGGRAPATAHPLGSNGRVGISPDTLMELACKQELFRDGWVEGVSSYP